MPGLQADLHKLREAGYKITPARMAVLEVIHASERHLTSAEVLGQIDARQPSIGRASVFRALELLSALAIIRPTYLEARTPAYVLMSQEGHHSHIVCTACNRVIELDECHVDNLVYDLEQRYGVRLTGHMLEFYGICESCACTGRVARQEVDRKRG